MGSEKYVTNHDLWLNRIRWKIANKEFRSIDSLTLDCFHYSFGQCGLTQEQQEKLVEFMGDSDHLNSINQAEFCNFFIKNDIAFKLSFAYSKKRDWKYNLMCYIAIRKMNKQIKEILKRRKINND